MDRVTSNDRVLDVIEELMLLLVVRGNSVMSFGCFLMFLPLLERRDTVYT